MIDKVLKQKEEVKLSDEIITIKKFYEIVKNKKNGYNTLDSRILLLSIITGYSVDYLENLEINKLKKLAKKVSKISLGVNPKKFISSFIIDDIKYSAKKNDNNIPIITVNHGFVLSKYINNKEEITLNKFAAIFYVEDGGDLSDESIENRAKIFENLPIIYVVPFLI